MKFQDRVCIVTGGGSGIGRATCLHLAREGARVAVLDLSAAGGKETVHLIAAAGGKAAFLQCDMGDAAQIEKAVADTLSQLGGQIHVLVNNAAIMTFFPVVDVPVDAWDQVLAVNLRGPFVLCKAALPHMPDGSAIVNVSSVHAHETTVNVSPYAASKGGIEAFSRALSIELQPRKIRVNCVAPGAVNTPMLWNNPNIKSGAEHVTGAVGEPEDIAAAIAYLASDDAKFTTGTTLICDGGRLDVL